MTVPSTGEQKLKPHQKVGTLAIDLGNNTTVVAFQGELDSKPILLDLPPISRIEGGVPSIVWYCPKKTPNVLVGQQVIDSGLIGQENPYLISDFKRWIGANKTSNISSSNLSPEQAGELLLQEIWAQLPQHIKIKRLVLTAPVETYREYRTWLNKVCNELPVEEVALVDEPTAAALGAGIPAGAKLLVVDIGGSTIDLSLVALEGGEGRAAPVPQLLRFGGKTLEGTSKQILRCAKVLGKAGYQLGGRDFDRWIANHLYPDVPVSELLLNACEKLKCRLSKSDLKETEFLSEIVEDQSGRNQHQLSLCRLNLEELLVKQGLLKILDDLLKQTLASARANGCELEDLQGVVVVGGGAYMPIVRRWLGKQCEPTPLLTPPPLEAVAIGALRLTPGVQVKDVLHRGVSLRCWDQRSKKHCWHQLFLAGQPWPTTNPLEIVLAASKINQSELELIIGEPESQGNHEVIYINGLPTIQELPAESKYTPLAKNTKSILLNPPGQPGEDCLRLKFNINEKCQLQMEGIDIRNGFQLNKTTLGSIR